ncbi:MAG: diacylglycerol kinase family lipid kinase [Clostridia bacterium]|nr:diacylglycerol kinase family lipid kinase [Clostridia bacterium]
MKKVLLIINPKSGKSKSKFMLFEIINTLSLNGCIVTTRITQKIGDATLFAEDACKEGIYDLIIACGGDGTLSETVAGVVKMQNRPDIGYIPCGSTNDYARSFGISTDYKKAAEGAATGKPIPVDIGLINGKSFNYIASFGLFTAVSYSASRTLKSMLGHMAYVLAGTKELAKIKSIHAKVETDSGTFEDDFLFGAIANSTSIGGVVKLDETLVSFNDGMFEICLVRKPKKTSEILNVIRGALKSDFSSESFEFFKASSVKITTPEGLAWSLDGEKAVPGENVEIEILKSAVNLVL